MTTIRAQAKNDTTAIPAPTLVLLTKKFYYINPKTIDFFLDIQKER